MADSFQCMTKPTTIKKIIIKTKTKKIDSETAKRLYWKASEIQTKSSG